MFTISNELLLVILGVLLALVLVAVMVILIMWNKNVHLKTDKKIAELEIEHLTLKLSNKEERIKLQSELIAKNAECNAFKDFIMSEVIKILPPSSIYNLRVRLKNLQKNSKKSSERVWRQLDQILESAYNK